MLTPLKGVVKPCIIRRAEGPCFASDSGRPGGMVGSAGVSETHGLRAIPPRGTLKLPVAVAAPFPTLDAKPPGTTVHRSEPVVAVPPSAPAALAPMNGVVGGVERVMLSSGREAPAVALEPLSESDVPHAPVSTAADDGPERLAAVLRDAETTDLSHYIDRLRLAGVWADRWTSPDLLGQLYQSLKRPVDTVICSALDFDDALPLQQAIAREHALEIVAAVATLAAAARAKRVLIAVDASSDGASARAVGKWSAQTRVPTTVLTLRNSYPQPNPTLLLYTLARRKLRPGRLPTEAGALLFDAVAAVAIGRCLLYGEPLLQTPLGVADMRDERVRTHLLTVPVGMTTADILREAGAAPGALELRGGSPLREIRLGADCIVSAGGEVALYVVAPQPHVIPAPCVRCGWCVSGCPVHMHPAGLLEAAQGQDTARADRFGLESCIECGVCSYVCPSHLPLLGGIRSLRAARS